MFKKKKSNKKGMTLVELLVALGILIITTAGLSSFFAYIWTDKARGITEGKSSFLASEAVAKMTKNIRKASQADSGAYLIDSGDDFDFIFYCDIDDDDNIERIHYYLEDGFLKMGKSNPILGTNPTYPEDDEEIDIVTGSITNDLNLPIFYYYDESGSALETPVDVSLVKRVGISLMVNVNPKEGSNVLVESSISFRNISN